MNDEIDKERMPMGEQKVIVQPEFESQKNTPELELKLEPQLVDYDTVKCFLPEKWEMPRKGKLLYHDEEVQSVLKLLTFQLGVEKSLDQIPRSLIEEYLSQSKSNANNQLSQVVASLSIPENEVINSNLNEEDTPDLLNEVLTIAQAKMSKPSFETWLANLKGYKEMDKDTLIILADNEFQRDWVETRYSNFIKDILEGITGRRFTLTVDVKSANGVGVFK
ncbi:DnaA N-terminal domain-containing protein [Alkalihalobacterium alkalinitrilicum]|uniref:DnaA N-terminal domain-containing protein n=1 Tax=Alkalihalobacterium alkalinitrilicum TaxID=427920 RepID=UPI000994BA1D|nr:DnaA N-terminal domain-containing protein [Alkalihalobacterium alkalinitrilicum]